MDGNKLLVCIAFHYIPDRIGQLMKVIDRLTTYNMDVHVIVDSNSSFSLPERNEVVICTHSLSHPYHLAWMHRKHFKENIHEYDWFMYLEDDMDVPYENFNEYVSNFEMLWNLNCVPSFVRIEEYNNKKFVTDVTSVQKLQKVMIGNKEFVSLSQPYHAFWIMPKKELLSTLSSNFVRTELSRENAASYPMWELGRKPLVRVENDRISPLCYSFHLTNNYAPYSCTPFGKIEIDKLLS
jgi:hypothetical protein